MCAFVLYYECLLCLCCVCICCRVLRCVFVVLCVLCVLCFVCECLVFVFVLFVFVCLCRVCVVTFVLVFENSGRAVGGSKPTINHSCSNTLFFGGYKPSRNHKCSTCMWSPIPLNKKTCAFLFNYGGVTTCLKTIIVIKNVGDLTPSKPCLCLKCRGIPSQNRTCPRKWGTRPISKRTHFKQLWRVQHPINAILFQNCLGTPKIHFEPIMFDKSGGGEGQSFSKL